MVVGPHVQYTSTALWPVPNRLSTVIETGQRSVRGEGVFAMEELLAMAEQIAGHRFQDQRLLEAAVTHASLADHRLASNERLEFLGDAILGMIVCEELYHRYPEYLEGEMTKIKSVVVSRKVCAALSDKIGLTQLLRLGKGMADNGKIPSSVRAGVMEAFIAALYLDAGLGVVREFMTPLAADFIREAAESQDKKNYKSFLQQHAQKYMDSAPRYEALDEKGPDHSKCFEVAVVINTRRFPSAWAPSKKEAEQRAALKALQELRLAPVDAG